MWRGAKYKVCTEKRMYPSFRVLVDYKKYYGCPNHDQLLLSVPCDISKDVKYVLMMLTVYVLALFYHGTRTPGVCKELDEKISPKIRNICRPRSKCSTFWEVHM